MACIWKKCYCKVVFRAVFCFFGSHSFPCRSLLLGTNVPNDIHTHIYVTHCLGASKAIAGQYILYCPATRDVARERGQYLDSGWEHLSFDVHFELLVWLYIYICVCVCVCVCACRRVCVCVWPDLPYTCSFMCLIMLKLEQSAFTQTFFSSLSGIHQCSGGL